MVELNFEWKRQTAQYANGYNLYLNHICVASYDWHLSSKDPDWVGLVNLPSIKNKRIANDDDKELRQKLEDIVKSWFDEALKSEVENEK